MHRTNDQFISGQLLLADYQTVFVSAATIQAAKYEANESERSLMDHLSMMRGEAYLNPNNINDDARTDITRASLDAHFKKSQVQQLDSMSTQQLQMLVDQDRLNYIGKKIRVNVLDGRKDVIESVWFNQQTGYRNSIVKRPHIRGIVQDVLLDKNLLILKPSLGLRIINPQLQNYLVYVIDPATLLPMVSFTLI